MFKLDRDLADALCTVIACGFLDKMAGRYEPGASSGNFTDFIKEGGEREEARYKKLRDKLLAVGIRVEFQAPPSKEEAPFIMAKARKLVPEAQRGLQQEMKEWSNALENKINRVSGNLRGAYLGGYSTVGKTKVLGVSDLFQYMPEFRTADAAEIGSAYEAARAVTNTVASSLSAPHSFVDAIPEELKPVEEGYRAPNLFGSVHGMTRAILRFSPLSDADTQSVRFELALGAATNKVASCIPCSLLMSAVGQPATATHLGRGDNWNFPPNADPYIKGRWAEYVHDCYRRGRSRLEGLQDKPLLSRWFRESGAAEDQVPGIFLEALTYESAFMSKLEHVLEL